MEVKNDEAVAVAPATRTFECKKCHRSFSSFQALGGHSSRCNGPCPDGGRGRQKQSAEVECHECSVCGRCFKTGQALGGHKTLHRKPAKNAGSKKPLDIDLNQPPPAEDQEEEEGAKLPCFAREVGDADIQKPSGCALQIGA